MSVVMVYVTISIEIEKLVPNVREQFVEASNVKQSMAAARTCNGTKIGRPVILDD